MTECLCYTATAGFEAARSLERLAPTHRARRLHGHSFNVALRAVLPNDWAAYRGGEAAQLHLRLAEAVAPLDYQHLNLQLDDPGDEQIARWIAARLQVPGLRGLQLRSRPDAGVDLDEDGVASYWRRYRFEAAHWLPNVPEGHPCGRLHGHGFSVTVHAGAATNAEAADAHDMIDRAWAPLKDRLDGGCLNELEGLANPTSEMLAVWLWQRLQARLPQLRWVGINETASSGTHYDGARCHIWKGFSFDSALRLARAPDSRVHGHTYQLRLHLQAPLDRVMGWIVDFGDVKTCFDPILRSLDHHPLHRQRDDADLASLLREIRARAQPLLTSLDRIDLHDMPGRGAMLSWRDRAPLLPI